MGMLGMLNTVTKVSTPWYWKLIGSCIGLGSWAAPWLLPQASCSAFAVLCLRPCGTAGNVKEGAQQHYPSLLCPWSPGPPSGGRSVVRFNKAKCSVLHWEYNNLFLQAGDLLPPFPPLASLNRMFSPYRHLQQGSSVGIFSLSLCSTVMVEPRLLCCTWPSRKWRKKNPNHCTRGSQVCPVQGSVECLSWFWYNTC